MLTMIGRAAARRVATPMVMTTTLPIRQARAFIATPVAFEAAEKEGKPKKAKPAYGEKPKTPGRPKKSDEKKGVGRPSKGEKRAKRVYHKMTEEEVQARREKGNEKRIKTLERKKLVAARDKKIILKKQALLKEAPTLAKSIRANGYLVLARERRLHGDDMASIGERWSNMSASEKEELHKKAEEEKVEMRRAYHAWIEAQPVEKIALANEARKAINEVRKEFGKKEYKMLDDPRLPTGKMLVPFNFFVRDHAKRHHGTPVVELMKEAADKWKTMSEAEKHPWNLMYEGEKEKTLRFRAELEEKMKVLRDSYKAAPEVPADAESA